MARDKELQDRRCEKIINYYAKLSDLREFGVKKHTSTWCIAKTADFFDIRPKTVENYLYRQVE